MPGSVKPRMAAAATEDAFNSGRIAPGSSWRARGKCRHRPGPWHDATMKLQCLQTLAAVLRHGTFAAAAQEVHLSAGAVSLQMQQLALAKLKRKLGAAPETPPRGAPPPRYA